MNIFKSIMFTYDHRLEIIGHPVRSAIHKLHNHLDICLAIRALPRDIYALSITVSILLSCLDTSANRMRTRIYV